MTTENIPQTAREWTNRGVELRAVGEAGPAISCYRRALELEPDNPLIWGNLGNALKDLDRLDEAVASHRRAISLTGAGSPLRAKFQHNLAISLKYAGRFDEALRALDESVNLAPKDLALRWERSLIALQTGDYLRGFSEYGARWAMKGSGSMQWPAPLWKGEPLSGKRILLLNEQGFGDTFMALRYLPLLKAAGAEIVLEARAETERLFLLLDDVSAVVRRGNPTSVDFCCPVMSLPGLFGTTIRTIPPPLCFRAPEASQEKARLLVGRDWRLRVGIIWSGSVTFADNNRRSTGIDSFLRLAEIPEVSLYSLQKGPREADLNRPGISLVIRPLGPEIEDFVDTAALAQELDLIIMTDSSTAHLAASLGRPVWNLLSFIPYWIYGSEGATTPWYPSMRLFRQRTPGDWQTLFRSVENELRGLAVSRSS
ncbi:MAG: tetratricopeptide repeat protein [Nitrospirales bacterium]|nr:tetratricopeptide repeat protein [Nitrospirales bacterium]